MQAQSKTSADYGDYFDYHSNNIIRKNPNTSNSGSLGTGFKAGLPASGLNKLK